MAKRLEDPQIDETLSSNLLNSPRLMDNRRILIDAARQCLLSDGLPGLRFERIATAAGMTRKSVYNHFGSRAGLMEALMDDIGQRAGFSGLAGVWEVEEPKALIYGYFSALTKGWEADRDLFRLLGGLAAADSQLSAVVSTRISRVQQIAARLAQQLSSVPGLLPNWTVDDAKASLYALSVFTTFDALCKAGLDQATAAQRLADLAAAPFDWR